MRQVFFSCLAVGISVVLGDTVAFCQTLSPAEMLRIARSEAAVNNLTSAFKIAKETITRNPDHVDARLFLGELYLSTRKPDSARIQYNRILKDNPSNPRALAENYELEFRNRNFGFALHFAEEGLKYYPGSADFKQKRTVALKALGLLKGPEGASFSGQSERITTTRQPAPERPAEQQKTITTVVASTARRPTTEVQRSENPVAGNSKPTASKASPAATTTGLIHDASKTNDQAISPGIQSQTQPVKNALTSDELYQLARTEVFERNNYASGIEYMKKAVAQTPDDARFRTFLGRIYTWSNQQDNARTQFNRVLGLRPSYADALSASFDLEYWTGNNWFALVIAENALKFYPTSEEFTIKKVQALSSLNKPAEALKILNKFLLETPDSKAASGLKTSIETGTAFNSILH